MLFYFDNFQVFLGHYEYKENYNKLRLKHLLNKTIIVKMSLGVNINVVMQITKKDSLQ